MIVNPSLLPSKIWLVQLSVVNEYITKLVWISDVGKLGEILSYYKTFQYYQHITLYDNECVIRETNKCQKMKKAFREKRNDQQTRTSNLTIGYERTSHFVIYPGSLAPQTHAATDWQQWHHRNLMRQDSGSLITHMQRDGGRSALTDGIYMIILTTSRHPWAFTLDSIRSKWILVTICKEGSVSLKARVMDWMGRI